MDNGPATVPGLLQKPARPEVLGGVTVRVVTGCGKMYVQLNWCRGRLFEIFATLGHGGGCATCEMEGLTRSITLGLKCGVPLAEYIHQLKGIRCPVPVPFPKEAAVDSCPDGIAKVLTRYGALGVDGVVALLRDLNGDVADEAVEAAQAALRIEKLARAREEQGL